MKLKKKKKSKKSGPLRCPYVDGSAMGILFDELKDGEWHDKEDLQEMIGADLDGRLGRFRREGVAYGWEMEEDEAGQVRMVLGAKSDEKKRAGLRICRASHTRWVLTGGQGIGTIMTESRTCPLCGGPTVVATLERIDAGQKSDEKSQSIVDDGQKEIAALIERRCLQLGCPGAVSRVLVGPVVTQYDFSPSKLTRIAKLKSLHEDLALSLSAEAVQVMRIPGQSVVGITVPNRERKMILFSDTLKKFLEKRDAMPLPLNLGVDSIGNPVIEDLAQMPHLLISGSTGSGKSTLLHSILDSLLYVRTPRQMELVLIDLKTVELMPYRGLPHLKREPVTTVYDALAVLEIAVQQVKKRMILAEHWKTRNLAELNEKLPVEDRLPHIVVVIEEFAELVLTEKKKFIELMVMIAGMARAAGIHVIATTQRPSVDVLSGKVKVNFPARICFRMPSASDSRTVLNRSGAEQLCAKGDMMYISPNRPGLMRVHGPLVEPSDTRRMMALSLEFGHYNRCPADAVQSGETTAPWEPVGTPQTTRVQ